jgi:hypothetical protein
MYELAHLYFSRQMLMYEKYSIISMGEHNHIPLLVIGKAKSQLLLKNCTEILTAKTYFKDKWYI